MFGLFSHVTKAGDVRNREISCQTLLQIRYICTDLWNIHLLEKDFSMVASFIFPQMTDWGMPEVRQEQRFIF